MIDEPLRHEQHLVSKGYQRNFADGHDVANLDPTTGAIVEKRRPIKLNWRIPDFTSVPTDNGGLDDSLEKEFAKVERVVLNVVREIAPARPVSDRQKQALDQLAAQSFIREQA